ncbi:heme peroxidase [Phakopsora pachyrhizi]|uniref:Heme peroxidase n=1 Tax=Phakopsora pachyrhizi TaxID=170000 RepID=A0AAV0B2P7_PHAPC|nr:heme peroxidase [Phakopsora pachyrhizi]
MSFLSSSSALRRAQLEGGPKEGEGLLQSAGYTHLVQIGSAADLPTLSASPVWRRVSQLQETVGTVTNFLIPNKSRSGLDVEDTMTVIDEKDPTSLAYLGVQQLLAGRIPKDYKTAKNLISSLGKPLDDRKLLLEDIVAWLATAGRSRHHGPNSAVNNVQGQFINLLWNDLSHPPKMYIAPQYKYRTVDGSFNNLIGFPYLGAANQPYSRSVKPLHPISPDIAEPEDFFDAILRRPAGDNGFRPHPAGLSSLFFAFANLIIHDLFWTNNTGVLKPIPGQPETGSDNRDPNEQSYDPKNPSVNSRWQNLTSSYVSLDPLYGVNKEENDQVRDRSEENLGRGLLHNDTFASNRLLLMPPASTAILVLLSRNHNRVARKVLELNELNKWTQDLSKLTPEQRRIQDDEIFGTARLVNCGYCVNTVLHDYLQGILGTVQADSDWSLDPRAKIKSILGTPDTAVGNSVSIEFNILYRWHASISREQTVKWDDLDEISFGRAVAALRKELNAENDSEPRKWKLSKYEVTKLPSGEIERIDAGSYERDPETGRFNDRDLAKILKDAVNDVAGAFGAQHTPAVLRWVDCQGMKTSRDVWRACSLNEFRSFLGLKTFDTFEQWNSNPKIAKAMEDLVGTPDSIPLHVGLHGEEAKTPRLGAGLCPNYTISRAILADAVALVRGDRFYTEAESADSMTDWGLLDCQPDVQAGSYGGMMQKLLLTALPNQFAFNDVALMFPFMVPEQMYKILQKIGPEKARNYALNPPQPTPLGFKKSTGSHGQVTIHEVSATESVMIERMNELFGVANMKSKISGVYSTLDTVITGEEWMTFEKFIVERIRQGSTRRSPVSADQTVDILRDVTNPLITGWLSHIFGLVETGMHSKQLLLSALSDVYKYLHEPQMTFKNRSAARVAASGLAWQLKYHIEAAAAPSFSIGKLIKKGASIMTVGALNILEDTIKFFSGQPIIKNVHPDCRAFYENLTKQNARGAQLSSDELAADCLRAISTLAYTLANGTAHALDYLIPEVDGPNDLGRDLIQSLKDLVKHDEQDRKGFENLKIREIYCRHGLEASRLNHWNPILKGLVVKGENLNRNSANQAIGAIDDQWSLTRDDFEYKRLFDVDGHCLKFYEELIAIIIREVARLPRVRKSFGKQGILSKVKLRDCNSGIPSMHIKYDGTKIGLAN